MASDHDSAQREGMLPKKREQPDGQEEELCGGPRDGVDRFGHRLQPYPVRTHSGRGRCHPGRAAIMSAMSDAYERLAAEVAALVGDAGPVVVGIAGGVGVGKSTTAARIQEHLSAAAVTVEVVGTDAFLLPNDELERRDLGMRKGFPETFDTDALETFLRTVRAGVARGAGAGLLAHHL